MALSSSGKRSVPSCPASLWSLGLWEHMAIASEILAKKQRWSSQHSHGALISEKTLPLCQGRTPGFS